MASKEEDDPIPSAAGQSRLDKIKAHVKDFVEASPEEHTK
jgi:hypothetical protein